MVRSWWCLKEVRIRLVRCDPCCPPPPPCCCCCCEDEDPPPPSPPPPLPLPLPELSYTIPSIEDRSPPPPPSRSFKKIRSTTRSEKAPLPSTTQTEKPSSQIGSRYEIRAHRRLGRTAGRPSVNALFKSCQKRNQWHRLVMPDSDI